METNPILLLLTNPLVVIAIQVLAVAVVLWVLWPSENPNRRILTRLVSFVVAVSVFAGLIIWNPSKGRDNGFSLWAYLSCEDGGAFWCETGGDALVQDEGIREGVPRGTHRPFVDCQDDCPVMVLVPDRKVKITENARPTLAIGAYEITVKEYTACMDAGACEPPVWLRPAHEYNLVTGEKRLYARIGERQAGTNIVGVRWDRDITDEQYFACVYDNICPSSLWEHGGGKFDVKTNANPDDADVGQSVSGARVPVVGVSWKDAQAYTKWLSEKTGHPYRLLTSDEWEHVARAGMATVSGFGDEATRTCRFWPIPTGADDAIVDKFEAKNCVGAKVKLNNVDFRSANDYSVYGIQDNAWEWVEDCYPRPGQTEEDFAAQSVCERRGLRGGVQRNGNFSIHGSWSSLAPDDHYPMIGFRVAFEVE